ADHGRAGVDAEEGASAAEEGDADGHRPETPQGGAGQRSEREVVTRRDDAMRGAAGTVAGCMLCVGFVVVAGCNRKPHFVPPGGDSTGAAAFDSTTILAQDVSDLWDRATDRHSVSQASSATVRLAPPVPPRRAGPPLH